MYCKSAQLKFAYNVPSSRIKISTENIPVSDYKNWDQEQNLEMLGDIIQDSFKCNRHTPTHIKPYLEESQQDKRAVPRRSTDFVHWTHEMFWH